MRFIKYVIICLATCLAFAIIKFCQPNKNNQSAQITYPTEKTNQNATKPTPLTIIKDYSKYFQSLRGCAVIFDATKNEYVLYNENKCKTRFSPCSTFKIVSALVGLHNKIVTSEESKLGYDDNTTYPIEIWNSDLSLKDAFQNSCVWYFRKISDRVGKEKVSAELKDLSYGNCDISEWNGSGVNSFPELNGFWLESSLLISPIEQVDVLHKIIELETVYTKSEVEILKNIMLVKTTGSEKIYGKTGTGTNGTAWFVGFVENQKGNTYFAVYLDDKNSKVVNGSKAKEIALGILGK